MAGSSRPLLNPVQDNRFEFAQRKAETLSIKTTVELIATDRPAVVVDRCLQFLSGDADMTKCPIARAYTAVRVARIYGGTSEIVKEIVSRSL